MSLPCAYLCVHLHAPSTPVTNPSVTHTQCVLVCMLRRLDCAYNLTLLIASAAGGAVGQAGFETYMAAGEKAIDKFVSDN